MPFGALIMQWVRIILTILAIAVGHSASNAQSLPVTSGLRIWLDAKDVNAGAAQPTTGATVATWRDKSGNGNNVTSAGTASPVYNATGLNGFPTIRLAPSSKFSGSNIFPSTTSAQTTIFMVYNNVNTTTNFLLNLNGDNVDDSGTTARFSLHLPWGSGGFYFDAGGCCGSTRLAAAYPVAITRPVIMAAGNSTTTYSGFPGTINQFVRFDGVTRANDANAIAPVVSGGFRLGSTSGYSFDGNVSEVIIFDRALSLSEVQQVECYLAGKWAITVSGTGCSPITLGITKSHVGYAGNTLGNLNVPGSDVIYSLTVSRLTGNYIDADSLFLVDPLPSTLSFYNGDYDGTYGTATDPVGFSQSGSALTWAYSSAVRYSNAASAPASFSACTYTPTAGYDANVRYICIKPSGMFNAGNFTVSFRARIK